MLSGNTVGLYVESGDFVGVYVLSGDLEGCILKIYESNVECEIYEKARQTKDISYAMS